MHFILTENVRLILAVNRLPLLGRRHLLLGCQNPCYSTMIVLYGSPNCETLRTTALNHHPPNVENHKIRELHDNLKLNIEYYFY